MFDGKSAKAPEPRKGMPSPRLDEAEFKRRFRAQFQDQRARVDLSAASWNNETVLRIVQQQRRSPVATQTAKPVESSHQVPMYNWDTIPARELRSGIVQRVFRGNQVAIGYNLLHPGMATNPHSHDFEQLFLLLQGRVKLHVDDQVFDCGPGTIIRIPPNAVHWAEPPRPEDGVAVNMDIFSPIREDYYELTSYQTDKFDDA